jgi:hypothetical protein
MKRDGLAEISIVCMEALTSEQMYTPSGSVASAGHVNLVCCLSRLTERFARHGPCDGPALDVEGPE